ncbi:MAG: DsbA family protein [Pseudomonadota bacterium]
MGVSHPPVRMYYGYRSPYSRFGLHAVARAGLEPELIAFTGPPDGSSFSDPASSPAKVAYMMEDIPRTASKMGLPIAMPDPFEVDFGPANRATQAAKSDGKALAFALAVSDARWGDGADISQTAVLRKAAETAGWDADKAEAAAEDKDLSAAINDQRALIEEDQVFGVPFFVANGQKYWGQDRVPMLLEDLGVG